jgi:rod shape determining protein RodA
MQLPAPLPPNHCGLYRFKVSCLPRVNDLGQTHPRLLQRLYRIHWGLVSLSAVASGTGLIILYSAANGSIQPWATKQAVRFAIALVPFFTSAMLNLRHWFKISYYFYIIILMLCALVDLKGAVGMGAQRWIDLGLIQLQPSDLMSVALILALSRYFHSLSEEQTEKIRSIIAPILMIALPVALVLKQPDLGTAGVLLLNGVALLFVAGVRARFFLAMACMASLVLPIAWRFMRDYQKNRIYTFLDPNNDPLGAGYHILQSKIALGSGGLFGKGFLQGTQSHLSFLPEKHTDFIFTTLAEEFGLLGGLTLIGLYIAMLLCGFKIALRSRSAFGRVLGLGIVNNLFLYVFINIAMVAGLIPVVGIPLPLISYGGTAMLTVMFGFGLLMSVHIDGDLRLNRRGEAQST